MATQQRDAAIVGMHEYPSRDVQGTVSALQIKAACAIQALTDAGLTFADVDAIYDTGDGGVAGLGIADHFGIHPTVIDTTSVGGGSFEFHAAHAMRAIAAGKAKVALLTYGSVSRSAARQIGTGGGGVLPVAAPGANMEAPWGMTLIACYALAAQRHMYQHGTTSAQLAEISVAARAHAMRNPEAVQAMMALQFQDIREITVDDVLASRMVADPLHLLECCMVSDGGGAVVIASKEVARDCQHAPVWLLGSGEATKYRENDEDLTVTAGAQSAPIAFGQAGVRPDEMDIAMVYDSFSITVLSILEDLGFCEKGEGGAFVTGGRLRWDDPRKPALNTDGGGLSSNHPGMRGMFLLLESTRQLRGQSNSQVADAKLAVAHGNGGRLGATHSGGTIILARD